MSSPARALLGALSLCLLAGAQQAAAAPLVERPIVIAHRGASGYLPEETMAGYRLAVQMGADFIEPDLFLTADGVLVARHDRSLNATTNVQAVAATDPELFAKRSGTAYNVDLLTYADIQKLNARSRVATGYATPNNGYYTDADIIPVPTLREVLDYAYEVYTTTGRVVGVYPEVKTIPLTVPGAAEYHRRIAAAIVEMLGDPKYHGYFDGSLNNVYLQSFDQAVVQYLSSITELPVAFLTGCPATAEAAQAIATYADGIGFSRASAAASKECVDRAHAAGLIVHVYTLLSDPAQHEQVQGWGVDGVFGNHPDVTKAVRDAFYPLTAVGFKANLGSATVIQDAGQPEPVAGGDTAWQEVKGGSTVPLKFQVFDETAGTQLVTLLGAIETLRVHEVPGCSGAIGAELPYPSLATADGGMRYDAEAGQWQFNWKTPRTGVETCYRATLRTRDGSSLHLFVRARR